MELSKIDLLVQGKHWSDEADAAKLIPLLQAVFDQAGATNGLALRLHQNVGDISTMVALGSAQLKSAPQAKALRIEFRASMPVTADLRDHLAQANRILTDAVTRLIPAPGRFS